MDIRKRTGYNSDYNTIHTANLLQRGDAGLDAIGVASNVVMYGITMLAVTQDLSSMRISNRLILAGIMMGLGFRLWMQGPAAIVPFLVNISFPVIVLYLFFLMGAIGAGDIKLFSVIGSFVNFRQLVWCMGLSFVIGAVFSLCRMLKNRNLQISMFHAFSYIGMLLMGDYKTYDRNTSGEHNRIHFSLAICIGIVWVKGGGFCA